MPVMLELRGVDSEGVIVYTTEIPPLGFAFVPWSQLIDAYRDRGASRLMLLIE